LPADGKPVVARSIARLARVNALSGYLISTGVGLRVGLVVVVLAVVAFVVLRRRS